MKPSSRQLRILTRLENAPTPLLVARILHELLPDVSDEPLDPRFREIWNTAREDVLQRDDVPRSIVDKVDAIIGQIQLIDTGIKSIRLHPDQRVCLLLGAGASASAPSSIPTVLALLPELWRRARKLGRDDIDRLATWCEGREVSNIEDLLTAAYLANFASKNGSISSLLNYFLFREREYDEGLRGAYRRSVPGPPDRRRFCCVVSRNASRLVWSSYRNNDSGTTKRRSQCSCRFYQKNILILRS
jgi:hypothetical protein